MEPERTFGIVLDPKVQSVCLDLIGNSKQQVCQGNLRRTPGERTCAVLYATRCGNTVLAISHLEVFNWLDIHDKGRQFYNSALLLCLSNFAAEAALEGRGIETQHMQNVLGLLWVEYSVPFVYLELKTEDDERAGRLRELYNRFGGICVLSTYRLPQPLPPTETPRSGELWAIPLSAQLGTAPDTGAVNYFLYMGGALSLRL